MVFPQAPACAPALAGCPSASPLAILRWPMGLVGLFVLVFSVLALSGPGRIDIVDGQTRYEVGRSLYDHGDLIIRDRACWMAVLKGRDGNKYSNYRLPHSALGVAAIAVADVTTGLEPDESRRHFYFTLASAVMAAFLAVVYALWFRGLGLGIGASLAWAAAGIFCTPNWYYGTSTFDDILGTVGIVAAVAAAWLGRERRPLLAAAIAGLAMAWAVNCKPPLAVFALPVVAALYVPAMPVRRFLLPAGIVASGVALGMLAYMAFEAYKFPPGSEFAEAVAAGKGPTTWANNPLPGIFSLAFSPSCGVIWYCPPLFLAWRGWPSWRQRHYAFCLAVLTAAVLFTLFVSFLTFFKGEPSWGPRYLTPVCALAWVFAPAGLARTQPACGKTILALGVAVQLLGLSVDPQRLFVQLPLHWNYYDSYPWLGFDATISHLVQRPRELVEVLTPREVPAAEYCAAPLPTHAGGIPAAPPWATSVLGIMLAPNAPGPLNGVLAFYPVSNLQLPVVTHNAFHRYHIYNAPRPWIFSQWYLPPETRPVHMEKTILLLGCLAGAGLALMLLVQRNQSWQPSPSRSTATNT